MKINKNNIINEANICNWNKLLELENSKYALVDKNYNIILDDFDYAQSFEAWLSIVQKNSKYWVIDYKGNYLLPIEFSSIRLHIDNWFIKVEKFLEIKTVVTLKNKINF